MTTQEMINELIDAAFDSGYYQATLEKCSHTLTNEQLLEYTSLNQEALERRKSIRKLIEKELQ